jgi:anti-sigma factor ChrR (cupin superfamily)
MAANKIAAKAAAQAAVGQDALSSCYITVGDLPWQDTPFPGVRIKMLYEDKARGLMTQLVHMEPGATISFHEHVDIEQTYVLEGSLKDEEGECTAGNFVWRPAGNRHTATAPNGALLLGVFQKPNKFFDVKKMPPGFPRTEV